MINLIIKHGVDVACLLFCCIIVIVPDSWFFKPLALLGAWFFKPLALLGAVLSAFILGAKVQND